MNLIDLSLPIDDSAFEVHDVRIDRISHKDGIEKVNKVMMSKSISGRIKHMLGKRLIPADHFLDDEFLSLEVVHAPVHVGTHLDYTFHYGSTSEGKKSKTAEEIPLDWCCQNGVKLDCTHIKSPSVISKDVIVEALNKISYNLKPLDIVLLHTGADKLFGKPQYFSEYPGLDISAIDYLLDCGIKIFGVDTMGIDRPYKLMMKDYLSTNDPSNLWPSHFHGRKREFIHIERLANLENIPNLGFKIICFPVKIKTTGAAWARVVAQLA